jgi:hypothetical protein
MQAGGFRRRVPDQRGGHFNLMNVRALRIARVAADIPKDDHRAADADLDAHSSAERQIRPHQDDSIVKSGKRAGMLPEARRMQDEDRARLRARELHRVASDSSGGELAIERFNQHGCAPVRLTKAG